MSLRRAAVIREWAEHRVRIDDVAGTGEITAAVIAREIGTGGKRRASERAQIAAGAAIEDGVEEIHGAGARETKSAAAIRGGIAAERAVFNVHIRYERARDLSHPDRAAIDGRVCAEGAIANVRGRGVNGHAATDTPGRTDERAISAEGAVRNKRCVSRRIPLVDPNGGAVAIADIGGEGAVLKIDNATIDKNARGAVDHSGASDFAVRNR